MTSHYSVFSFWCTQVGPCEFLQTKLQSKKFTYLHAPKVTIYLPGSPTLMIIPRFYISFSLEYTLPYQALKTKKEKCFPIVYYFGIIHYIILGTAVLMNSKNFNGIIVLVEIPLLTIRFFAIVFLIKLLEQPTLHPNLCVF